MTKKENILNYLRQAIVSGEYKPGDHIVEQDICKRFSVSRSPVREAINQLEKEGLVKISPNAGAKVVELTLDDLSNIFDLLEVMQGAANRLACSELKDEDIKELEEMHFMMIEAANKNNLELFFELNVQFHRYIHRHANNKYIIEIWSKYRTITSPLIQFLPVIEGQARSSIDGHQKIIEAFKKRNHTLAELAAREHIKEAKKQMLEYYRGLKDPEQLPGLLRVSNDE